VLRVYAKLRPAQMGTCVRCRQRADVSKGDAASAASSSRLRSSIGGARRAGYATTCVVLVDPTITGNTTKRTGSATSTKPALASERLHWSAPWT